jgi:hypothetical protein
MCPIYKGSDPPPTIAKSFAARMNLVCVAAFLV